MAIYPNWANRTVWTGGNLDILRGMNTESVELIYADPPFNSNRTYSALIGSQAAGAAFKDTWTLEDVDEAWHGEIADRDPALYSVIEAAGVAHGKSMKSYLIMMGVRVLELRRGLKPSGSIYLHCAPTASQYLKTLMDAILGRENFRNDICWQRDPSHPDSRSFGRVADQILFYGSRISRDAVRGLLSPATIKAHDRHRDQRERYRPPRQPSAPLRSLQLEKGEPLHGVTRSRTRQGRHQARCQPNDIIPKIFGPVVDGSRENHAEPSKKGLGVHIRIAAWADGCSWRLPEKAVFPHGWGS